MKNSILGLWVFIAAHIFSARADGTNSTGWLTRPISLADALNTALAQNSAILKAKNDLEASHGLVVQTRAVALPQLTSSGTYRITDPKYVENFGSFNQPDQMIQILRSLTNSKLSRLSRRVVST